MSYTYHSLNKKLKSFILVSKSIIKLDIKPLFEVV